MAENKLLVVVPDYPSYFGIDSSYLEIVCILAISFQ